LKTNQKSKRKEVPKSLAMEKLSPSTNEFQGTDIKSLQISFVNHLEYSLAKDEYSATKRDFFKSLALTVRDRLIERWIETQQTYYREGAKRIYYLSMEFLLGRLLADAISNLGLTENINEAVTDLGYDPEELMNFESDAALGNGGLGRLAACFLDSMATLELPAYGYGIRYDYGIFYQRIIDGYQKEYPDNWLRYGNPWEIERPEYIYQVKYYGRVNEYKAKNGKIRFDWTDTDNIIAMAYDTPIPGYQNNTVNNLRLWAAKTTREFNLEYFNSGDYDRAVEDKIESEIISKVLYPRDDFYAGRELRLKQEYLLVSATLQDIIRRYKKTHSDNFDLFPDKVAIQLNDTHPVLSIPELMRILVDVEGLDWEEAWGITVKTFGYTNHTVMSEALEKWKVKLLELVLPRHLQIIYEINRRWLNELQQKYPGDRERIQNLSIIEEGEEKNVRMANLAILGSHSINGVAALHTEILKKEVFKGFYDFWPEKFNNKTNGITQRRWLKLANPGLSSLISEKIGEDWITNLAELKRLENYADDEDFRKKWNKVQRQNKVKLADFIQRRLKIRVNIDSIFDVQVKRLHEYKRQLLNALRAISLYNRIKANPGAEIVPRIIIFGGKAAPAYTMAKLIIKLINSIAEVVNNDPDVTDKLKVVFIPNYSVSLAQLIIPAADLSEQISTAGMEASGTGNMKFALNGALTIGTLDGANIEIREEVGQENIFIFGLTSEEVSNRRHLGHNPRSYYDSNSDLKHAIDLIQNGFFSPEEPALFKPIIDSLFDGGDHYMVLADYDSYIKCQDKIAKTFLDRERWSKMSIINVANMGKFSSDRTIQEYAGEIWKARSIPIKIPPHDKFEL
jgi:starch phosphorylase